MGDRATWRLVAGGTLGLGAAAGVYVRRFGSDQPNGDEWDMTAAVAGPFPWGWVLDHHNEHRYPLGQLVWAGVVRLAGDFRGPMLVTVGLLTVAAGLLIAAARRVRGSAAVGDLLFPALLLHWGHAFNLLMGYQVAFGLLVAGLAAVVAAAFLAAGRLSPLFLAGRHGNGFPFLRPDGLPAVAALQRAGWPKYRAVPPDPAFRLVPAALDVTRLACGPEPFLPGGPPPPGVELVPPAGAVGLRVRGEQHHPMGYQLLRVRYADHAAVARTAEAFPKVVPGGFSVTVPLDRPSSTVRLEAGCPMLGLTLEAADWLGPP